MAKLAADKLLRSSLSSSSSAAASSSDDVNAAVPSDAESFIRTSCNITKYKLLCFRFLAPYAGTIQQNPLLLSHTAVNITWDRVRFLQESVANRCVYCSLLEDAVVEISEADGEWNGKDFKVGGLFYFSF